MTPEQYYESVTVAWPDRLRMYRDIIGHGGTGAELGVQHGHNAAVLLEECKPKKLYLVDRWRGLPNPRKLPGGFKYAARQASRYKYVTGRFKGDKRIEILRYSTEDAVYCFSDETLDWVYIDANHKFAAVLLDIQLWAPKVKRGGLIMLHDFTMEISDGGVVEACLYELSDTSKYEVLGKTRYVKETKEMSSAAYRKL